MGYEHLTTERSENHVAVVGRHEFSSTHPDEPAHLIEITRIDLDSDRDRRGDERERPSQTDADSEREAQSVAVYQFLAD